MVQLVIDEYDNKEREIKTGIPRCFLVSPIFILIYRRVVFNKISEINPLVIVLLFVNDLDFIVCGNSVKQIVKSLGQVAKKAIE